MYKIEKSLFGFRLTFGGVIKKPEMEQWLNESQAQLKDAPQSFGILVDMRTLVPLTADAQEIMQKGQSLFKKAGLQRSCVVLESAILCFQFKQVSQSSGIYAFERYVNANDPNWESTALAWIRNGTDPDVSKKQAARA